MVVVAYIFSLQPLLHLSSGWEGSAAAAYEYEVERGHLDNRRSVGGNWMRADHRR